ncbi:ferredoxin subunits of nitrite reductase and ring-hydroxylating dioxygenases [Bellilinea caldifistulae]|uniref:Biphenyl 2,3-dioxygenase n=1 Tax=Bellilinea caldifistulae TaxID=360411 RepID=A0A0P6XX85_9CHLR|nr:non-heme iron oxygenase ferredoxin subunit [Bellilinea caldifistulae]KPL73877.1 biphenyl 2,3-dioxygenase [Bellilinea caldifistulae]GAP11163.1 ferredoxin subunits of nitrite reductase and ring-hydroxylating dioxygenases [Bellilinea caldifistulae]
MSEPIDLTDYSFYTVAKVEDLPPGERLFVEIGDVSIVVFNIAGKYFAIGDVCTHDDGPLGDGELDGHQIICPRHGARFDVRNGKVLSLPAVVDIPTYPVRVTENDIEVGVPD